MSLVVAQVDALTGAVLAIVASAFGSGDPRVSLTAVLDDPRGSPRHVLYVVLPLCLGQTPQAAEVIRQQPFRLRFFASAPLLLRRWPSPHRRPLSLPDPATAVGPPAARPPYEPAVRAHPAKSADRASRPSRPAPTVSRGGMFDDPARAMLAAWHMSLINAQPASPPPSFHHGRDGGSNGSTGSTSTSATSAWSRPSELRPFALPESNPFRRWVIQGRLGCDVLAVKGSGVLVLLAVFRDADNGRGHGGAEAAGVVCTVTVTCKSSTARSADGPLDNHADKADRYYRSLPPPPAMAAGFQDRGGGGGFRYVAKWKAFVARAALRAGQQRVVMIVALSGMQAELGRIECDVAAGTEAALLSSSASSASSAKGAPAQTSIRQWAEKADGSAAFGGSAGRTAGCPEGLFSAAPLDESSLDALVALHRRRRSASADSDEGVDCAAEPEQSEDTAAAEVAAVRAALEASRRESERCDEERLVQGIMASTCPLRLRLPAAPFVVDVASDDDDRPEPSRPCQKPCPTCTFMNTKPLALACELCGSEIHDDVDRPSHGLTEAALSTTTVPANAAENTKPVGNDRAAAAEQQRACIEARLRRFDERGAGPSCPSAYMSISKKP